jgi:hypothetical protein
LICTEVRRNPAACGTNQGDLERLFVANAGGHRGANLEKAQVAVINPLDLCRRSTEYYEERVSIENFLAIKFATQHDLYEQ